MSKKFIGIQIGPRQFEFPPNKLVVDSAGSYLKPKFIPSILMLYPFSWALDKALMPLSDKNSFSSNKAPSNFMSRFLGVKESSISSPLFNSSITV